MSFLFPLGPYLWTLKPVLELKMARGVIPERMADWPRVLILP